MDITENDAKKIVMILLLASLAILTYMIVRPVILSVIGGLILAYMFFPVHRRISKWVKNETTSAAIVSILVLLIITIPLLFLTPLVIQQAFQIFQMSQELDIPSLVRTVIPGASDQLVTQLDLTINNALGQATSSILTALVDYVVNFIVISLHLFLVAFVFFFALKDQEKFREFVSGLSPLNKSQEKKLVQQFKDMTSSIINGQIIAGLLQGILAGIGLLIFGVDNALVLTVLSVVLGIIPILGVGFVYVPVTIYLYLAGNPLIATLFLAYNVVIVSSVDNIIRTHVVSRKTQISQVIVLVAMIGGLFIFGVLGLMLGPLIIGYFITFLRAYREKTISSFFTSN